MSISAHQIVEVDCCVGHLDENEVIDRLKGNPKSESIPGDIQALVGFMTDECLATLNPRGVYKLFNPAICTLPPDYTEPGIKLVGTLVVLRGKCVYDRLRKATHCVMMASSAGTPETIERLKRRLVFTEQDAAVFEACLTVIGQRAADMTNAAIVKEALQLELYTDDFLSPGTRDFPLEQNDQIHFYTQAEKRLGMALADATTPLPAWSTLGIVGMYDKSQKGRRRACGRCKFREFCSIRAIGMNCHGNKGSFAQHASAAAR